MLGFYGASGSFGVFLKPIIAALDSTRGGTSGAMSVFMVMVGLVGIVAGRLTDRYGARAVLAAGAVLSIAGYALASRTSTLWELYIYFGIIVGTAMGACFVPVIATVSKRFTDKRVLAVGITTGGIGIGQMIIPLLAAHLIEDYDWRLAFVLMGVIVFLASIPAAIWLRGRPPQADAPSPDKAAMTAPQAWTIGQAVRTLQFWMFIIVGFATATGFYVLLVHVVPYATDTGIAATSAALILTVLNVGMITAQILIWFLARRIGSRPTIVIMLALQALALFLMMGAGGFQPLLALGVVFGFGFGGSNTLRLSMIPEIFGTKSGGEILGYISVAWATGGLVGPVLAGYIFDISQSYNAAFFTGGALLAIAAVAACFLKAPKRRD
jgi:MFS family permease